MPESVGLAQVCPDVTFAVKILFQHMIRPTSDTQTCMERVARCLRTLPHRSHFTQSDDRLSDRLQAQSDSERAGHVSSRMPHSGGSLELEGNTIHPCSKLHTDVVVWSGRSNSMQQAKLHRTPF